VTKTLEQFIGFRNAVMVKNFPKATPLASPDPSLLYGVELEIENTERDEWVVPGITGKEDNSLRNNGWEYVTQPMTFSNLAHCLGLFFAKSQVNANNYSERCSIHVHTNCRDLTWEQISTVCMLYQMLEPLFFTFVGEDRSRNIFCVPWSETQLTYNVVNRLAKSPNSLKDWQKYTALNLKTLWNYGTIEWRHMAGTHDLEKILNWCRLIACLFAYARKSSLEDTKKFVINLNSTSEYRKSIDILFGEWAHLLYVQNYETLLEEGVLNMKYALLAPDEVMKLSEYGEDGQDVIGDYEEDDDQPPLRAARPDANRFMEALAQVRQNADIRFVAEQAVQNPQPAAAQQTQQVVPPPPLWWGAAAEVQPEEQGIGAFRVRAIWQDMPRGFRHDERNHEIRTTANGRLQVRQRLRPLGAGPAPRNRF
jgi:hypothetical protein